MEKDYIFVVDDVFRKTNRNELSDVLEVFSKSTVEVLVLADFQQFEQQLKIRVKERVRLVIFDAVNAEYSHLEDSGYSNYFHRIYYDDIQKFHSMFPKAQSILVSSASREQLQKSEFLKRASQHPIFDKLFMDKDTLYNEIDKILKSLELLNEVAIREAKEKYSDEKYWKMHYVDDVRAEQRGWERM